MATTDELHRQIFDFECAECGGNDCVDDQASGDKVCTSCGLVAEAHAIDEHSEWRTFADSDKPGTDMNRVGGPVNHLLSDGGIGSTVIGRAAKGDAGGLVQTLQRIGNSSSSDRTILAASSAISKMCDSLRLPKTVQDYATELFKRAMDQGLVKGRSHSASCAAAIMLACRQGNLARSFEEVSKVTDKGNIKALTKAFKTMVANVLRPEEMKKTSGHPSDYMLRYCNQLGMGAQHIKACQQLIETCLPKGGQERSGRLAGHRPWDNRSPTSLVGAVLYIVSNLFLVTGKSTVRVPLTEISAIIRMSPNTIKSTTKDLQPDFPELLPDWIATPEQVQKMIDDGYSGGANA